MDSRCYGCASKFSVFKKECGCKNCGRSFCSGCRSFTAVVPRCGNTQQKVCKQCHEKLTGEGSQSSSAKWSPPENYKKRVAAFEAKQNQLKEQQKAAAKPPGRAGSRYQGLSKEDRAIAERLERLREERKPKSIPTQAEIEARLAALKEDGRGPIPSTEEMEDRLAVLQGRDPPSQARRPVHQPPDTRSLVQRTDDLLTQLSEEVAIDEHYRPRVQPQAVSSQSLNDLNRESEDCVCPANLDPKQLEEEKNKLLAEAAAELQEENTRQEKILQVAKRLAALKGEDPEKVTLENYKLPDSDEEVAEEEAIRRVLKQVRSGSCGLVYLPLSYTSSQRKQPWMKQVDSTFLQIRPPNQDPHNRTCVRKQSKRARLQPPQLLPGQIVMRMSYPGAVSATKMPLCAAMAVMGTSTASAVFGKAMMSLT
ncbi:abscission/NoCut checkpoint regulator isoform X1 [Manacus vitellinus]|uniref:abscission/NoCut checkpoint regulator isoform X1 n=1 Tax=Manacus vitellinus TaxID=328815 RepID=UPI000846E5E5|nr:abscission/NoCut checkpoint regulator isoform X1 [Manacus vitellinus]